MPIFWAIIFIAILEILSIIDMLFHIPSERKEWYFKLFYLCFLFSAATLYFFVKYLLTYGKNDDEYRAACLYGFNFLMLEQVVFAICSFTIGKILEEKEEPYIKFYYLGGAHILALFFVYWWRYSV